LRLKEGPDALDVSWRRRVVDHHGEIGPAVDGKAGIFQPGEGLNRWPAGHRFDAARVYRLALERGAAGVPFHAVAEEGVPFKDIAAIIGRHLKLPVVSKTPEEAEEHFGWFTRFAAIDVPTSSARTRAPLGWEPREATLLADMEQHYF
jgi:nucleoside-diphosphate-sugar epimerase